jgi:two-component system sensor histidine kinase PilS (NtrC family)
VGSSSLTQLLLPVSITVDPKLLGRRLTYVMLVRVILFTLILGGTVAVNLAWGTPEELGGPYVTFLFVFIAVIYVLNIGYAVVLRLWPRPVTLAAVQLFGDLISSAILVHGTGGADSAFVLFFLLTPIAAAVLMDRRAAMLIAGAAVVVFGVVVLLGFTQVLPPFPGQVRLPWTVTPGGLGRSLLINGSAMIAVAVLAGYLAEQLRHAAEQVEVQQAHIDDLATLNIDIIRCLESGLITVSDGGRVLSINRAAGEILGLPHAQASGRPLAHLCPELAELAEGSEVRRTEVSVERTSQAQLLGVSVSPLTDHLNRVRGRIINFQDLTAVRQMEEVVQRSEHLASLGRMAAAIAHEIRNPLASISGSLELLRAEDDLDPDNRKLMEIVLREIERLNTLITSFLEFARPRPPDLRRLELGQEIATITEGISLPGQDAPEVTLAQAEPDVWVDADRDQLKAILWNLVRNAAEAGETERVTVKILADNGGAVLTVADTGDGIPTDRLPHIFEPFFTSKELGTGLGLAMVHRMVQEHGGTIAVESEEGRGATFTITLPRAAPGRRGGSL